MFFLFFHSFFLFFLFYYNSYFLFLFLVPFHIKIPILYFHFWPPFSLLFLVLFHIKIPVLHFYFWPLFPLQYHSSFLFLPLFPIISPFLFIPLFHILYLCREPKMERVIRKQFMKALSPFTESVEAQLTKMAAHICSQDVKIKSLETKITELEINVGILDNVCTRQGLFIAGMFLFIFSYNFLLLNKNNPNSSCLFSYFSFLYDSKLCCLFFHK